LKWTKAENLEMSAPNSFAGIEGPPIPRKKAINQQRERTNMKTGNTTNETNLGGTFTFHGTSLAVQRMGYGAMQLAGPGVYGPPKDPDAAVAVLREAVAAGVNHIDTADFYGPHVTNQIIKKALHPYPRGLVIVTKLGARRPADGSWQPAVSSEDLIEGVHDNLRNLGLDMLDIVNYRAMGAIHGPQRGPLPGR
jgi:pyridoxine 4-dehydrogenase